MAARYREVFCGSEMKPREYVPLGDDQEDEFKGEREDPRGMSAAPASQREPTRRSSRGERKSRTGEGKDRTFLSHNPIFWPLKLSPSLLMAIGAATGERNKGRKGEELESIS